MNYHYKDLIKEMDAFSEAAPTHLQKEKAKQYMLALITEELLMIREELLNSQNNSFVSKLAIHRKVLQLKNIIEERGDQSRDQTPTQQYLQLLNDAQKQNLTQTLFRSWLRSMSPMQKLFAVANHYFAKYVETAVINDVEITPKSDRSTRACI